MRLTKSKLKRLIKEELKNILIERPPDPSLRLLHPPPVGSIASSTPRPAKPKYSGPYQTPKEIRDHLMRAYQCGDHKTKKSDGCGGIMGVNAKAWVWEKGYIRRKLRSMRKRDKAGNFIKSQKDVENWYKKHVLPYIQIAIMETPVHRIDPSLSWAEQQTIWADTLKRKGFEGPGLALLGLHTTKEDPLHPRSQQSRAISDIYMGPRSLASASGRVEAHEIFHAIDAASTRRQDGRLRKGQRVRAKKRYQSGRDIAKICECFPWVCGSKAAGQPHFKWAHEIYDAILLGRSYLGRFYVGSDVKKMRDPAFAWEFRGVSDLRKALTHTKKTTFSDPKKGTPHMTDARIAHCLNQISQVEDPRRRLRVYV